MAEIVAEVDKVIAAHLVDITSKRYHTNNGVLLGTVRSALPWADTALVTESLTVKVVGTPLFHVLLELAPLIPFSPPSIRAHPFSS